MLSAITAFIGAIPALISLVTTIINFIKEEETLAAKKALANNLAGAIKTASVTGDTSSLENIFKTGNAPQP